MCTATLTDDSTRSVLGRVYDRIQKYISPNRTTPTSGLNDNGHVYLKGEYKEANQDTHKTCAEYITAAFKRPDIVFATNLKWTGIVKYRSLKKSNYGTGYSPAFYEKKQEQEEQIKNLQELGQLCKNAKRRETQAKSMLRDYEKKNQYKKSPSHEKYQSKTTTKKLKAKAKQNKKT
ncbi:hypothetical protein BASA61_001447 [Batrachochytrium salamandrivorans]|nr:hypothetical protein BASA61_001447 [Batrachochytrium salamandrivorans]